MKKYTDGPWELNKEGSHCRGIGTIHWCGSNEDENYWYEILGANCPETPMEREANAHLIAAAPELLEALERMMAGHCVECACGLDVSPREEDTDMATAAIKKAKGEPLK